jgi:hypothetical protein
MHESNRRVLLGNYSYLCLAQSPSIGYQYE